MAHSSSQTAGLLECVSSTVHLALEPAPKDLSRMEGPVGQVHVGSTGFAVDLERKIYESIRVHNRDVEVEGRMCLAHST